jgi:mono/diheme cytochrome c family protein
MHTPVGPVSSAHDDRSCYGRAVLFAALIVLVAGPSAAAQENSRTQAASTGRTGEQTYRAACVACHGPDGRGQPRSVLGFEPPASFPDFTDCPVSSVEPDAMWIAVVHRGGRVRGLSHVMPAFEDALTDVEIRRVVQYLHSLCAEPRWPRGNLNFPRAFFTEKAFPENETVFTMNAVSSHSRAFENRVDYERRIGRRAQLEVGAPLNLRQNASGSWSRGLGDINAALKYAFFDSNRRGSIAAAGGEVTLPTGKEAEGLGGGVTIFEAFGLYDQALPRAAFVQVHAGFERPADRDVEPSSLYWRTALGKTVNQNRFGRTWTPMVEILGAREFLRGARTEWDLVPQMQMSLSVFQHVRLDVGVRLPVNQRQTRSKSVLAYLLWDWGDGGFFELWRAH